MSLSSVWLGSLKNAKLIPFHDNHDHVNSGDGFDRSAHEMTQFQFLRGQSKAARKITQPWISGESRLWLILRSAWRNSMGYSPREKKGSGKLVAFQGSPSFSWRQKVCTDEQAAPDKTQILKGRIQEMEPGIGEPGGMHDEGLGLEKPKSTRI